MTRTANMQGTYTLYGSYASYYTAKTRSYLRKKGIPFVERLPSDPLFREKVRPTSGSHRIPQLLTPDGEVVQDSVEIQDLLEARFPELAAIPATPCQKVFVHLMELLASEGLVQLAWMHRWLFEGNLKFVTMDFGRSFRPQGDDAQLMKYGRLIADRMMSQGLPEATPELKARLDEQYLQLLSLFESHLISHPYFLGGHPSAADYAIMGAMHAHLGRDPVGLGMMQQHAPRVFRWVEHMIVPEVQSPEFFDRPVEFEPDDKVPDTALQIMAYIASEFGEKFVLGAIAFNQAMERIAPESGYQLNPEQDQPLLPEETITHKGDTRKVRANLHAIWLSQRSQRCFQSLALQDQRRVQEMLPTGPATDLVTLPATTPITRVNNRLIIA
jgi:glutathione S-transferase